MGRLAGARGAHDMQPKRCGYRQVVDLRQAACRQTRRHSAVHEARRISYNGAARCAAAV